MTYYIKRMTIVAVTLVFILISCKDSGTNAGEEAELNTLDSTAKVVEQNTDSLEEQTKKVEASLEKLDKEFDSTDK